MVSQLGDMNSIFKKFIDKTVFIIDTAGPVTRKSMFKGLRFTNTFKGISFNSFYQVIYAMEYFFIGFLPKQIVVPGVVREDQLHSMSSFSVPFSFSSWAIDSIKRLVFLGDRKR